MNSKPVQLVPEAMWPNHVAEADFVVASKGNGSPGGYGEGCGRPFHA